MDHNLFERYQAPSKAQAYPVASWKREEEPGGIVAWHPEPTSRPPAPSPVPIFNTCAELTLSPGSSPSKSPPPYGAGDWYAQACACPPAPAAPPPVLSSSGGPSPASAAAVIGAQQANTELRQRVAQLEAVQLAAAAAQASPAGPPPPQVDEEEVLELRGRLASKQREVEGLHRALGQQEAQLKARIAELETAQAREVALVDELAGWKEQATRVEREQSSLHRKLETATSHSGLLDSTLASLCKENEGLSTRLAQAESVGRQLQERLRDMEESVRGAAGREVQAAQAAAAAAADEAQAAQREASELWQRLQEAEADRAQLTDALLLAQEEVGQLRGRCQQLERAASAAAAGPTAAFSRSSSLHSRQSAGGSSVATAPLVRPPASAAAADTAAALQRQGSSAGVEGFVLHRRPGTSSPTASCYAWQAAQQAADVRGATRAGWAASEGALEVAGWGTAHDNPYGPGYGAAEHDARPGSLPQPYQQVPTMQAARAMPCGSELGHADHQQGPEHLASSRHRWACQEDARSAGRSGGSWGRTPEQGSPGQGTVDEELLARTQALEERLTALTAEKNELQAEQARWPASTAGKTLQVRKRRAEVEARLEEIHREQSALRLQLKRLGAK